MKTKTDKIALFDRLASSRHFWKNKNRYYYQSVEKLYRFLVPRGASVLELGCGSGELLVACEPSRGMGIDFSEQMIELARQQAHSENHCTWTLADAESFNHEQTFDYVIISDLLGESSDVWQLFVNTRKYCEPSTRLAISYFNPLWEPVLNLAERMGWKMPQDHQNWLNRDDVANLLALADFEIVKSGAQVLVPVGIPLLSEFVNRYIAPLPLINRLCLVNYVVAKPKRIQPPAKDKQPSVSVVIPCRNEKGNIRSSIERVPMMGSHTEIIYMDGNSNDGTVEEIEAIIEEYRGTHDIKLMHQLPAGDTDGADHGRMLKLGKGDAVRKAFAAASCDVVMILDADLTVMPEELPRFYEALVMTNADFINGTRLVYPMEKEAMRFLNKIANWLFAWCFSWILGQRLKDTLCGTKVLYKSDYERIAANRSYFGDFDPFGDFDLIFGAAKQNMKIIDMPVHYVERVSGDIKIERFRHGWLLLRMTLFALKKLKFY